MNKSLKAGVLIAILGIPALAFVFLKIFGQNNFDLPYYFPAIDDGGEVVVQNGDTTFATIPHFTLINQNGDSVEYQPSKITAVNFFFSRCGTICPAVNGNMAHVAETFRKNSSVRFMGISVDPKYDKPEVLKTYSKSLGIDKLQYDLLTGDKAYIYNLSIKNFKLPVSDASEYNENIKDIDEMFIHSEKVLLLDKQAHVRGIYDGTDKEDMDRLKVEIKVLLSQEES